MIGRRTTNIVKLDSRIFEPNPNLRWLILPDQKSVARKKHVLCQPEGEMQHPK